jgi:hypothetical protein
MCALAWLFRGPYIVTAVALMATLFALEAWQRRKVWLAILADLIYIEAYFLALLALNISEPQFFTTGAALLGIILHYLLRKMGTPKLTFLAGLTSQFILLGGSFIQMVATENLTFFLLLFFQAMVVIAYGTVVRSRSLVLAPIGFLVLGVSAIVYKAYRDRLSLLVVSCTGFLLLMLGISGLFLRERIGAAGRRVSAVFSEWSA